MSPKLRLIAVAAIGVVLIGFGFELFLGHTSPLRILPGQESAPPLRPSVSPGVRAAGEASLKRMNDAPDMPLNSGQKF